MAWTDARRARVATTAVALVALTLPPLASAQSPITTEAGLVSGADSGVTGVRQYPRHSLRRSAGRAQPLEGTAAGREVGRRQGGHEVRRPLRAGPRLRRHGVPRRDERGLPGRQRVDRRELADGEAAGDGVDLWRRLPGRLRVGAAPGRRAARVQGRRRRQHELSARPDGLPRASGADEGVAAQGLRQLRHPRSDRGAAVGAEEHRRVRRRSGQRHHLRRVGRLVLRQHPDGVAAGQGPLPQGHRRERRVVPVGTAAAARRGDAGVGGSRR